MKKKLKATLLKKLMKKTLQMYRYLVTKNILIKYN